MLLGFSEQATVFEPGQFGGNTGDAVTVDATIVGFDAISQAGYFLDQVTGITGLLSKLSGADLSAILAAVTTTAATNLP